MTPDPGIAEDMRTVASILMAGGLVSWLGTAAVRRLAHSMQLVDHPNSRSSHVRPTPRGGGLAVVVAFGLCVMWLDRISPGNAGLSVFIGPPIIVALIGLADDRQPIAARWRFAVHTVAAAWALWRLAKLPLLQALGMTLDLGWIALILGGLYLVWMVNLFNFMDGLDGIAGVEAITVALGGALCSWILAGGDSWRVPVLLACCVGGFLVWNLPPAKIFLGDVGSGFLGLTIGILSLWTAQAAPVLIWCWLILIGCFMVDATTTLLRRVARGERFYEAHRSHAYQHASRVHGSHLVVTASVGAINALWLLPWALGVAMGKVDGPVALLAAYAPLLWLAYRYKAGDRAAQQR